VGRSATASAARPRQSFRLSLHPPPSRHEDPRSFNCASFTLAKGPCRAPNRLDPTRSSRPPHRIRRGPVAARAEKLCCVLQPDPNSCLIEQECTGFSTPAEARPYHKHLSSWPATSPVRPSLGFDHAQAASPRLTLWKRLLSSLEKTTKLSNKILSSTAG
jgi:hypothetical protein